MKKWEKPGITNLALEFTKNDFEPYNGNGNLVICPECCKTSNPNAGGNHPFHTGGSHFATNDQSVLVYNDGSIVCHLS